MYLYSECDFFNILLAFTRSKVFYQYYTKLFVKERRIVMNALFLKDYEMMTEKKWSFFAGMARVIKHRNLRFCFWGRLASEKKWYSGIAKTLQRGHERKYGLEINFDKIGGVSCLPIHTI